MAILRLRKGASPGSIFPVFNCREPTIVGRDSENDVCIDDDRASRHHARFFRHFGAWVVHDLGSSNGTLVDSKPVVQARIGDGQTVQIGNSLFSFHADEIQPPDGREIYGARTTASMREEGAVFVHRAYQAALDREVRIDVLPRPERQNESFRAAFRAALRDARQLRHPSVDALVHAEATPDGSGFVVLRLRRGELLSTMLSSVLALPLASRLSLWRTIVDACFARAALEYLRFPIGLHQIVVDVDEAGSARAAVAAIETAALMTAVTGSVCHLAEYADYVPPEIAGAEGQEAALTVAGLAYSVGAIGYHLLTGRPPMGDDSVRKRLENHASVLAASPALVAPEVPEDVSRLVLELLDKSAGARPVDRAAILQRIDRAQPQATDRPVTGTRAPVPPSGGGTARRPVAAPPPVRRSGEVVAASGAAKPHRAAAAPAASMDRPAGPTATGGAPRVAPGSPSTPGAPSIPRRGRVPLVVLATLWTAIWVGLYFAARWLAKAAFTELLG